MRNTVAHWVRLDMTLSHRCKPTNLKGCGGTKHNAVLHARLHKSGHEYMRVCTQRCSCAHRDVGTYARQCACVASPGQVCTRVMIGMSLEGLGK